MKHNLTFEEEKRKEFIYVLFNAVFVCVCIVFVLNFLVGAFCGKIYADSPVKNDLLDNILRSFMLAVVLVAPFVFYASRSDISLKNVLKPRKLNFIWMIFGTLAVTGSSVFIVLLSEIAVSFLGSFGYVINEYTPFVFGKSADDIISVFFLSLFSSLSSELVFRGIITERFRRANTGLALIIPALIASGLTGSLVRMPYVFISGLLLSWIYMKTSSVYTVFFASFIRDISLYLIFLFKEELTEHMIVCVFAGMLAAVAGFVLLIIRYGIKTVYPAPRDDDDEYMRMSAGESVFGVLKAFSFWIFIFGIVFTIYFFYLSNPTVELP